MASDISRPQSVTPSYDVDRHFLILIPDATTICFQKSNGNSCVTNQQAHKSGKALIARPPTAQQDHGRLGRNCTQNKIMGDAAGHTRAHNKIMGDAAGHKTTNNKIMGDLDVIVRTIRLWRRCGT